MTGQVVGVAPYNLDATVEATDHASSVKNHYAANLAYNYTCVACHDPHGTTNIAMMNTTIVDGMGADATGVTLATEAGLDPVGVDNGVCDRCHTDGGQPHANTTMVGNHNQGAVCISCHKHEVSFQGSCTTCHGNPANAAHGNAATIWPDGINNNTNWSSYADSAAGAHDKHIALLQSKEGFGLTITEQKAMCAYCHPNPGVGGHDANNAPLNQADVNPAGFLRIDGVSNAAGTADGTIISQAWG